MKPLMEPAIAAAQRLAMGWDANVPNKIWRVLLAVSGSHTALRGAGTYAFGVGDPLALASLGTLYPLSTIFLDPAELIAMQGVATTLRIRAQLYTNDVAPGGNYTVGLHSITRPSVSGTAGQCRYTLGAAVAGSQVTFAAPVADSLLSAVSASFAVPAAGHYVIGLVTTATVASSAHVHLGACLAMRN